MVQEHIHKEFSNEGSMRNKLHKFSYVWKYIYFILLLSEHSGWVQKSIKMHYFQNFEGTIHCLLASRLLLSLIISLIVGLLKVIFSLTKSFKYMLLFLSFYNFIIIV